MTEPGDSAPDSRGCRLLVASYSDVAPVVAAVTARARDRIVQSPALGDFVDVWFADLGPRPHAGDKAERAGAVTRIAAALTRPARDPDLSYFGLLVADRSVAAAAGVLASCAADPAIGALPMRRRVLASIDDRRAGPDVDGAEVRLPPGKAWRHEDLIDEVHRYADDLLTVFGTGHERGLTPAELAALRPPAAPADTPTPDPLTPDPLTPDPLTPPAEPSPPPGSKAESEHQAAEHGAAETGPSSRVRRAPRVPHVRLPGLWRKAPPNAAPPTASVVVYLVLTGVRSDAGWAAWRRGRSVLLELDRRLSTGNGASYLTRVLDSARADPDALGPAGRLTARDFRHPAGSHLGVAGALGSLPLLLPADYRSAMRVAPLTAAPVLVIYAADAPLADAVTMASYIPLAAKIPILWLLPATAVRLLSGTFRDGVNVRLLTDHPAITQDLTDLIRAAGRVQAGE